MSEREIAQRIYSQMQKSPNPSAFDAMGAFSQAYNQGQGQGSLSVPLDAARGIDPTQRQFHPLFCISFIACFLEGKP